MIWRAVSTINGQLGDLWTLKTLFDWGESRFLAGLVFPSRTVGSLQFTLRSFLAESRTDWARLRYAKGVWEACENPSDGELQ